MGVTTRAVTFQEFLKMAELEGQRIELLGGEVVTVGHGKFTHEEVKKNLTKILMVFLLQHPTLELYVETMFKLDEYDSLMPDLSALAPARKRTTKPGGHFLGAPDLAIEVVSSESAERLERKVDLYVAHGSRSVWTVYPGQRLVRVFNAKKQATTFEQNQILEDPILPGFQTPVAAIFEGL